MTSKPIGGGRDCLDSCAVRRLNRCYRTPLLRWRGQARLIEPGMSEAQAIACLREYDAIERRENQSFLIMTPRRQP